MRRCSGVEYFCPGSCIRIVSMLAVSIPRLNEYILRKLRIINPAPTRSTSVSASSATTIVETRRRARTAPELPRPPSFSTSFTLVLETCSAGASPKMMPVVRQIAAK